MALLASVAAAAITIGAAPGVLGAQAAHAATVTVGTCPRTSTPSAAPC